MSTTYGFAPTVEPIQTDPGRGIRSFWPLGGSNDEIAVTDSARSLTYSQLAAQARDRSREWGERQLVLLHMDSSIEAVISYLACVIGGHVGIVVGSEQDKLVARVQSEYVPTVVAGTLGWERTGAIAPDMHSDLRLLLSTSGATGSPKFVRISKQNLESNTQDIVTTLGLTASDRTLTTLPLHYCYGLSVLNSHLLAGGSIHLSAHSVADRCFWDTVDRIRPTTLATVPYTLRLLDSVSWGFEDTSSLRLVTVAGGAVSDAEQRRWRTAAYAAGISFVTMYGQTEATARMAVLAPDDYEPERTGKPVPTGRFWIDETLDDRPGVGEIIYAGPNVMMGYALVREDLRRSAEVRELRTGDLGRVIDGFLQVCGRRKDFLKVCGLRIDAAAVASELRGLGVDAAITCVNDRFGVLIEARHLDPQLVGIIAELTGLPPAAMAIQVCPELPRTSSGKVDTAAAHLLLETLADSDVGTLPLNNTEEGLPDNVGEPQRKDVTVAVQQAYRDVLQLSHTPAVSASFVSLHGDSLSYVAVSTRLQRDGVMLPTGWQHHSIAELASANQPRMGRPARAWTRVFAPVESTVVLRAIAIVLIVGSHIDVIEIVGGAHLLLVVVGLNLAQFQLASPTRRLFISSVSRSVVRLLIPVLVWLIPVWLIASEYGASVLLVNNLVGSPVDSPEWRYWFLEAALVCILMTALIVAVPSIWRVWQRRPEYVGITLLVVAIGWLLLIDRPTQGPGEFFTPAVTAWMFALGLTVAAMRNKSWIWQVTLFLAALGICSFYFDHSVRATVFLIGVAVLMWIPRIQLPRALIPLFAMLATASLGIYLTHYQVYPLFGALGWLGLVASLLAGSLYWYAISKATNVMLGRVRIAGSPYVSEGPPGTPTRRDLPVAEGTAGAPN
jgi:acyl-coenzyme A synthetase/AMP-(fatty) acid ligase